MLRGGLYRVFSSSLLAKNQYRAIVDNSFHSVLEWFVCQKRFRTCLNQTRKRKEQLQVTRTYIQRLYG
jgi:hypothetical protein